MSVPLNRFCIFGLHRKYDIDIPIKDNRLILVGVNGLGKTTVVNILYFLLTEQWSRLFEFEFSQLAVEIGSEFIKIPRDDLDGIDDFREQFERLSRGKLGRHLLPPRYLIKLSSHRLLAELLRLRDEKNDSARLVDKTKNDPFNNLAEVIAGDIGVPPTVIARVINEIPKNSQGENPPSVDAFRAALRMVGEYQVLYLPTYRRIEQDLKAIFPDLEEQQISEL